MTVRDTLLPVTTPHRNFVQMYRVPVSLDSTLLPISASTKTGTATVEEPDQDIHSALKATQTRTRIAEESDMDVGQETYCAIPVLTR